MSRLEPDPLAILRAVLATAGPGTCPNPDES
jgi:hypothetical protein